MSDRVAEALAALEAAEKEATRAPWEWGWSNDITQPPTSLFDRASGDQGVPLDSYIVNPAICATSRTKSGYEDAEFIAKARNSFPALLSIARHAAGMGEMSEALNDLADAVLGPAPTPEEHGAP